MKITPLIFATTLLSASLPSFAGVYTDQLSKCLVESTSTKDRNNLVRWMFSAAAKHPAVSEIVNVTPEILEKSSKDMGELLTKLLTVSCKEETKKALKFEGQSTIEASFSVLGQVAGRELFTNPKVAEGIANLEKYIDQAALEKLTLQ